MLKALWEEWRDIVHQYDPTRPWISADGEDETQAIDSIEKYLGNK